MSDQKWTTPDIAKVLERKRQQESTMTPNVGAYPIGFPGMQRRQPVSPAKPVPPCPQGEICPLEKK